MNPSGSKAVDYSEDTKKFKEFVTHYIHSTRSVDGDVEQTRKYEDLLQQVANRQQILVDIELDDLFRHGKDSAFITRIEENAIRYIRLFSNCVFDLLPPPSIVLPPELSDAHDVLREQRERAAEQGDDSLPKELLRRFELHIVPRAATRVTPLREIKAKQIGKLLRVRGIVTRITEVKPHVVIAAYTCDGCGCEIFQEVTSSTFMPILECKTKDCRKTKTTLQNRGSKFEKFQEIKIQELTEQVPIGHIPRAMKVWVRGELTRQCSPGDIITLDAVFLPTPYQGYKGVRAGLLADTYLEGMRITQHKKSYADYVLTPEILAEIENAAQDPDIYTRLAKSIAPEIYGHEDVKKALLMMMVGGVTRNTNDGMKIRGDINICLMGDPGVAKSQLLKHIATVAPRGIYTSGKGASGVGLTAAVVKDPVTGEWILEGGSLVLADMGICCIDEFDKMEESDRTAIHEVMEQQTISIAKAGITTTLNARTAVLAAANPAYGRYNPRRTPEENFNLPAALMSRFDLLFLLIDRPNADSDKMLAEHVTYVHQNATHPKLTVEVFSAEFLRGYIAQARNVNPFIPKDLTEYIVAAYVSMRTEEDKPTSATYTTARSLLGILRLAQAAARLRFSPIVQQPDVEEAIRLMHMSKASILLDQQNQKNVDPSSAIYNTIRDYAASSKSKSISYEEILQRILAKGHTQHQLHACLDEYHSLGVWILDPKHTFVRFVS
eukprot:Phypoly_transcript_03498.p1 GENE.Phypoly_transcript_03498~~Phypoly_transcript_03498.p1  ORF type:complete len:722 (+),score=117.51 Phypoly_transcript_03498:139-2304(+)